MARVLHKPLSLARCGMASPEALQNRSPAPRRELFHVLASIATDLINSGPFNLTQFTNGIHGFVSSLLSYAFAPELKLPRLSQWNFTLDQALSGHDQLSIGYVGSRGSRLILRKVGGPGKRETLSLAAHSP